MRPHPGSYSERVRIFPGGKRRFCAVLAGALLLLAASTACSAAPHTATPTATVPPPTPTTISTATPQQLSPAGVYMLTVRALHVLSLANGTVQHSYTYDNPGANVMGNNVSSMTIAGGSIFFVVGGTASGAATVMALRATDGSELWRFPMPSTNGAPDLSVSVLDGRVFVGAYSVGFPGTFYALSAVDGQKIWQVQAATIRPPATVVDGVVYLAVQPDDGTQHLLALRATDGSQLWDFPLPSSCSVLALPAVVDQGLVYLTCLFTTGTSPGDAYAVRASDGQLMWHVGGLGPSELAPAAGDGLVYVVAGSCGPVYQPQCAPLYTYALDERTGAVRWHIQGCDSGVVVAVSALYCYLGDTLAALDPATGAVRWRFALTSVQRLESRSPTLAGGVLYLQADERIIAVDAGTGALRWRSPTLTDAPGVVFVVPQA